VKSEPYAKKLAVKINFSCENSLLGGEKKAIAHFAPLKILAVKINLRVKIHS